eukprot:gene20487-9969_t
MTTIKTPTTTTSQPRPQPLQQVAVMFARFSVWYQLNPCMVVVGLYATLAIPMLTLAMILSSAIRTQYTNPRQRAHTGYAEGKWLYGLWTGLKGSGGGGSGYNNVFASIFMDLMKWLGLLALQVAVVVAVFIVWYQLRTGCPDCCFCTMLLPAIMLVQLTAWFLFIDEIRCRIGTCEGRQPPPHPHGSAFEAEVLAKFKDLGAQVIQIVDDAVVAKDVQKAEVLAKFEALKQEVRSVFVQPGAAAAESSAADGQSTANDSADPPSAASA